jgi:hypothetical protein
LYTSEPVGNETNLSASCHQILSLISISFLWSSVPMAQLHECSY